MIVISSNQFLTWDNTFHLSAITRVLTLSSRPLVYDSHYVGDNVLEFHKCVQNSDILTLWQELASVNIFREIEL